MRASIAALITVVTLLIFLTLRGGAQSLQDIPVASGGANSPVVAELFTSQSCSSCPPAEKLFSALAERDDLIVLEWHVDYWDHLVHGRAGAWKDPYSDAAHTKRQRQYNRALRGTANVYTPQAVINGRTETIGSHASEIDHLLARDPRTPIDLKIEAMDGALTARLPALHQRLERPAEVLRLTLLPEQTTAIPSGENRGAILSSKNIVLAAQNIGTTTEPRLRFRSISRRKATLARSSFKKGAGRSSARLLARAIAAEPLYQTKRNKLSDVTVLRKIEQCEDPPKSLGATEHVQSDR